MASKKAPELANRDIRQRDLVPPDRLARCHAVVIGVGSIGRQVALQLAATGVPVLTLLDPDTVAVENLATQGFSPNDVNSFKVDAVGNACHEQCPMLELHARHERFRKSVVRTWSKSQEHCVFVCVDAIESRRLIWEAVRGAASVFIDGRMTAEVVRVLASDCPAIDAVYPATLFGAAEAFAGACTAKSTIYTANIAAGLMVGQFARWLRRQRVTPDQTLNLLAAELTVADPTS
ncbi:MAG: ThiF family adenylyltransferase [Gemmataceae bacterium]